MDILRVSRLFQVYYSNRWDRKLHLHIKVLIQRSFRLVLID